MQKTILKTFASAAVFVCAVFAALPATSNAAVGDKSKLKKRDPQAREAAGIKAPKPPETEEVVVIDFELRFGKIAKIQNNTAFVHIISRIPEAEIPPTFYACDARLNPVAELESLKTGYRDCFLFKVSRGEARQGDTVMVRYYKTVLVPKSGATK